MPYPNILETSLLQTAVYWAPQLDTNGVQVVDNYGKVLFAAPVELCVRWDDVTKTFLNKKGNVMISIAEVRVPQDVVELGVLWQGKLGQITTASQGINGDPFTNPEAWEIRLFKKYPKRRPYDFLRIAIL